MNIFLMISGISVLVIGVYSCQQNEDFSWYNGSFIFIGCIVVASAFIGHLTRYSPMYLFIYEILLCVSFILQVIFAGLVYTNPHLKLDSDYNDLFKFTILLLVFIILTCAALAAWYWKTLTKANKPEKEKEPESTHSPFLKI